MRWSHAQLVPLFLWSQAIAVAVWWLTLWWAPALRPWFVIGDWPPATLFAFALPDGLVIVLGSATVAFGLQHRWAWASPLLCALAGAVVYATLWCVGANLTTGTGWLSTSLMLVSGVGTVWALGASKS